MRAVSIHAPARGAAGVHPVLHLDRHVSIHAPARGAIGYVKSHLDRFGVSIHAPARGATRSVHLTSTISGRFNSRTRERCDEIAFRTFTKSQEFQFTHPREVRHGGGLVLRQVEEVSIHAPARGATADRGELSAERDVSIHAPARGATPVASLAGGVSEVSIHAPARGATWELLHNAKIEWLFQFTHPRGVRPPPEPMGGCLIVFQFTHPRGVRPEQCRGGLRVRSVSIHAPARGATHEVGDVEPAEVVSIHAPARGATADRRPSDKKREGFNSRTREGCDRWLRTMPRSRASFNSRTREGCDLPSLGAAGRRGSFNSRTREGCDDSCPR